MFDFMKSKVLSLVMTIVLLFSSTVYFLPGISTKAINAEIDYNFSDSAFYSAAGTITVESGTNGEYDLFWGDSSGKILTEKVGTYSVSYSEFATVDVKKGKGSTEINKFTVIPESAEKVLAYKNKVFAGSMDLPEEKITKWDKPDYLFGAISDIHFGKHKLADIIDYATISLQNSMNFFEKSGVSFVAATGDITTTGDRKSLENFNKCTSKYSFPTYTCTGNHDIRGDSINGAWKELVNPGVYSDETPDGIIDREGFDFVYTPDGKDYFIFLSQSNSLYQTPSSRLLKDSQLDWLEKEFEKFSDKTVYLFFHSFLSNQETGDIRTGEGNVVNKNDIYYKNVYYPGSSDEVRFTGLLKKYKNVIFFNGHSHFEFALQEMNPILNITDYDGKTCTMVHIPSVTSPRILDNDSKELNSSWLRKSQGYLVKSYPDKVVLQGVDFLKGKFISLACYVIEK